MSRIEHHPNEETLVSYSAGSLPAALALVVGCHLQFCAACRRELGSLESLGGGLISAIEPQPLPSDAREKMLAMLDSPSAISVSEAIPVKPAAVPGMPELLRKLTGVDDYDALPWKTAAPGIRQLVLKTGEGNSRLLRIAAGKKMPVHSHTGTELTLILRGGYSDALGNFNPGDVADLDDQVEHQPMAFADEDCICLAGLDAPIAFRSWLAKLVQPFVGM